MAEQRYGSNQVDGSVGIHAALPAYVRAACLAAYSGCLSSSDAGAAALSIATDFIVEYDLFQLILSAGIGLGIRHTVL